jgi:hypothetical protein
MEHSYSYSVLRVIPNQRRGECVNVGVVVFRPDGDTQVRMLSSLNKVYALDANIDVSQFDDLPQMIIDWVSGTEGVSRKHDALNNLESLPSQILDRLTVTRSNTTFLWITS